MSKKLTAPQLNLLKRIHDRTVYIGYPSSNSYGSVPRQTADKLIRDGLIEAEPYRALKGRKLVVTTLGLAVLTQLTLTPQHEEN